MRKIYKTWKKIVDSNRQKETYRQYIQQIDTIFKKPCILGQYHFLEGQQNYM